MLGIWGESGAIGSGMSVAPMSDGFQRLQGASQCLRLGVHSQEGECGVDCGGGKKVETSLNLKFFLANVAGVPFTVSPILPKVCFTHRVDIILMTISLCIAIESNGKISISQDRAWRSAGKIAF